MSDFTVTEADIIVAQRLRISELENAIRDINIEYERCKVTLREVLAGCGASLEEKLRATIAVAEVSAKITLALRYPTAPLSPQRSSTIVQGDNDGRCSARRDGKRCIRAVALDHVSLCSGQHDFGPMPDSVRPYRPRLQLVPR